MASSPAAVVEDVLSADFLSRFLQNPEQALIDPDSMEPDAGSSRKLRTYSALNQNVFMSTATGSTLTECKCSSFNRLSDNTRRKDVEKRVVGFVTTSFPREKLLHVASWASGGFFQNFVLLCLLIQAGYKHISFSFIDTAYDMGGAYYIHVNVNASGKIGVSTDFLSQVKKTYANLFRPSLPLSDWESHTVLTHMQDFKFFINLMQQLARQYDLSLHLNCYTHAAAAVKVDGRYDLITAIDFNDMLDYLHDFQLLHQHLDDAGRFFTAFYEYDLDFSKNACVYQHITAISKVDSPIRLDIDTCFSRHKPTYVNYTQMNISNGALNRLQWLHIIPDLSKLPCAKLHITYFNDLSDSIEVAPHALFYFLKFFMPAGKKLWITKITEEPRLLKHLSEIKLNPDEINIVAALGMNTSTSLYEDYWVELTRKPLQTDESQKRKQFDRIAAMQRLSPETYCCVLCDIDDFHIDSGKDSNGPLWQRGTQKTMHYVGRRYHGEALVFEQTHPLPAPLSFLERSTIAISSDLGTAPIDTFTLARSSTPEPCALNPAKRTMLPPLSSAPVSLSEPFPAPAIFTGTPSFFQSTPAAPASSLSLSKNLLFKS